jgi:hypothetical protein
MEWAAAAAVVVVVVMVGEVVVVGGKQWLHITMYHSLVFSP